MAVARADGSASARRLGGHVRRAWPAKKAHRPKTAIGRWLARQVGPLTPVACAKRGAKARAHCASRKGKGRASASASSIAKGASSKATARTENVSLRLSTGKRIQQLQLIRSFDIPIDDPSYERLLNWSWTYDSAVAATAFASVGLQEQSGRLLDQLAALQRKDGSIEFAFDVQTGESSGSIRAGSIAFAAIAFSDYDSAFGSNLYLDNARRAADYLLSLRNEDGLVRGGPDVKWVSTQHNILTLIALMTLSGQLKNSGDESAAVYREAAEVIAKGIDSQLIVRDEGLAHFRQGVNDNVVPLDTQALGIIYAMFRDDQDLAKQVYEYTQQNFPLEEPLDHPLDQTEELQHDLPGQGSLPRLPPLHRQGRPGRALVRGHRRDALRLHLPRPADRRTRPEHELLVGRDPQAEPRPPRRRPHHHQQPVQRVPRVADRGRRRLDRPQRGGPGHRLGRPDPGAAAGAAATALSIDHLPALAQASGRVTPNF